MSQSKSNDLQLKPPEVPPPVTMNDPDFENLTSAEKLNNREYRSLIYRAFPNERLCACSIDPRARQTSPARSCPGVCPNNCCNRARPTVTTTKNNTDSCGNSRSENYNAIHCQLKNEVRMRGGGCEDLYRKWEDLDTSRIPRCQTSATPWANSASFPNYYYKPRAENSPSEPPGNSANSSSPKCKTSPQSCGDSPCIGAECFLRTLRETQEFVDSLGKVPGLAGLGLEDPSESPYFRTREPPTEEVETVPLKDSKKTKRHSRGQAHEKPQNVNDPVVIKTKPFVLPSSGKRAPFLGSLPSFEPHDLEKSGEPPVEGAGPCGESGCRSRRRIKPAASSSHEIIKSKDRERRSFRRSFQGRRLNRRRNRGAVPAHGGEGLRSPRRRVRYVYLAGDTYPGGTFGHKNCNDPRKRVPANMGWLWNESQGLGRLKPRVGWRPGALSRTLRDIIRATRAGALEDSRSRSAHSRSKLKTRSQTSVKKTQSKRLDDEEDEPPPTLHVLRRDGTYYVTMYPIKQETMDVPQLEVPMKPLQFKIVKNKNESDTESSTNSDIEIEFSPPAAVNRYRRKPDVVHVDVQVKQQEILDAFKPPVEKKKDKKAKKGKKEK